MFGLFRHPPPVSTRKIFAIGLSGTGTRSLARALEILGLRVKHYPESLDDFERYEALLDIPVSCRYRELDVLFPNARFILTTRDLASWLDNRSRKPPDEKPESLWVRETRLRMYGLPAFEREHYRKRFKEYHDGVAAYFAARPGDLLVMDVVGGAGWPALCAFLGVAAIPQVPFPAIRNQHSPRQPQTG